MEQRAVRTEQTERTAALRKAEQVVEAEAVTTLVSAGQAATEVFAEEEAEEAALEQLVALAETEATAT